MERDDKKGSLVNAVEVKNGWEKVRLQVDSGAIDTVAPKTVGRHLPVRETEAVKRKMGYVAANGTKIANYGERILRGLNEEGKELSMVVQVADVIKPLASVHRMNEAGNVVVLDGEDSYTLNKQTGNVTPIAWEDGRFMFDMWIPKPKIVEEVVLRKDLARPLAVVTRNPFQALAVEEGYPGISGEEQAEIDRYAELVDSPGFSWRDKLW